jgi:hypothetical protein
MVSGGSLLQHSGKGMFLADGLAKSPGKDESAPFLMEPGKERVVPNQLHNEVIHQYSLQ